MKVAIIHYWWLSNRGGEAVVTELIDIYPEADLYIHVADEDLVKSTLGPRFKGRIFKSFISSLPAPNKFYQKYLPFMPIALEQWDLSAYDLILSSESGPAKGVLSRPDALHICYCHSPMRYIWDMYHVYAYGAGLVVRYLFAFISHWLRVWDYASAARVDYFIANSNYISSRIRKFYRRDSEVIFPPVNVESFLHTRNRSDFYLLLGQLVPYKRADLAIEAFNRLGLPLIVIGEGEQFNELKKIAAPNITLLGRQPFSVVKEYLETCKALIFPGLEDFGIVPVEAMAAGAPVVAFGRGGVLDTVIHGVTGILFREQSAEAVISAVKLVESNAFSFDPEVLHAHALKFDRKVFRESILKVVNKIYHEL